MHDIDADKLKNNVLALADLANYFKLSTSLTTSFETGQNVSRRYCFRTSQGKSTPGITKAWCFSM